MTVAEASGTHVVQFYETERTLHHAIGQFFAPALRDGDPIVIIARRRTCEAVADLVASEHGGPAHEAARRIRFIDVDAALQTFMDADMPDPVRFAESVSSLLARARPRRPDGPIWFYGEMVDVLCQAGRHAAAVWVEELWNDMRVGRNVSVLCGYATEGFAGHAHARHFQNVCMQHTHVLPVEALPRTAVTALSTVHVVDDDASMRRSIARLVASVDLRVSTFASAEAFLAEVDATAHGCLVLDVQLRGMSGLDLLRRMTEAGWSMPVIAISAALDVGIERDMRWQGASTFLRKPFDAQALLAAIARALR